MYDVVESKSIKVAQTSKGFDRCDEMLLSIWKDEGDDSDDVWARRGKLHVTVRETLCSKIAGES